jgi:hypothetical protein
MDKGRLTRSRDPSLPVAQVGITDVDDDPAFLLALGSEVVEKVRNNQIGTHGPVLIIDLQRPVTSDAVIETLDIWPGGVPTDPSRRIGMQHHNRHSTMGWSGAP